MSDEKAGLHLLGFMIDERAVVFVRDDTANRHFLEGIDPQYWTYLAKVHGDQLENADSAHRQRTGAALRQAYGQGLETLFALLCAFVQAPSFPLGWMASYRNRELRAAIGKIHRGERLPSPLKQRATWRSLSEVVHAFVPDEIRTEIAGRYADLWKRLAEEFLVETFGPEYNSLKHGMRAHVSGFAVSVGAETTPGQAAPAEAMQTIGSTEYGSTFWMPPEKVDGYKRTYNLTRHVSRAWVPEQFITALQLIGMSIRNVVSRSLITAGEDPTTLQFVSPQDRDFFQAPWRKWTSITNLSWSQSVDLSGWVEPTPEEIRRVYEHQEGERSGGPASTGET